MFEIKVDCWRYFTLFPKQKRFRSQVESFLSSSLSKYVFCFYFELGIHFNVYILAPENEFPEIIYALFGERQNIFTTIFGTKFVVICAAKILKIG